MEPFDQGEIGRRQSEAIRTSRPQVLQSLGPLRMPEQSAESLLWNSRNSAGMLTPCRSHSFIALVIVRKEFEHLVCCAECLWARETFGTRDVRR